MAARAPREARGRRGVRAVAVTSLDEEPGLVDVPEPEVGADEVLVRIHASSINPVDVYTARRSYRPEDYELPTILGWDLAGVVERVGKDVDRFLVGDEVLGYWPSPRAAPGAWADLIAVSEKAYLAPKPAQLGFHEAAALPVAGVTALLLVDAIAPSAGEVIAIVGAAGAVGRHAVQLAAGRGATVVATARAADTERILDLGAAATIDYSLEDVGSALARLHPGGIDGLVDIVDDRNELAALVPHVREGGGVASARFAADADALQACGIKATNVAADRCGGAWLERVAELAGSGALDVDIGEVRPLEDSLRALEEVARGGRGKVVLAVA